MATIGDTRRLLTARLTPSAGPREARWMARIILETLTGKSNVDLLLRADSELSPYLQGKADEVARRVAAGEPLQYVLGQAWWHGYTLEVNPSVLIPRPETSELADIIIDDTPPSATDLRVLDLGTGSGCLAIALALCLRFPQVTAVDISPEALDTARRNAARLKARVAFAEADILALPAPAAPLDIIVSNPPYVLLSEEAAMDPRVWAHEPRTALFVPDDDSLRFYLPILSYAARWLSPGGRLYLEINPLQAGALSSAATAAGLRDVELLRDSSGKQRFLKAIHP